MSKQTKQNMGGLKLFYCKIGMSWHKHIITTFATEGKYHISGLVVAASKMRKIMFAIFKKDRPYDLMPSKKNGSVL